MLTYPDASACLQATSAWNCWWAGFQIGQHELWGLSILAWARIGKALQFLSAAFILIEIVGPTRLQHASKQIAGWPTPFRRGLLSLSTVGKWFKTFLTSLPKIGILLSLLLMPVGLIVIALDYFGVVAMSPTPLAASAAASAPESAHTPVPVLERLSIATGDYWASRVVGGLLILGLGVFGLLMAYSLLVAGITKGVELISAALSWLTGHSRLQVGAKLISWILFVIGFGLDFLAS